MICNLLPEWVDGKFEWSAPLIPDSELIVSASGALPPTRIGDMSGATIGTVLGYRYPALDEALGDHYVRDDAPSILTNIQKLRANYIRYAIINRLSLAYAAKTDPALNQLPTLRLDDVNTRCAYSPRSLISFPAMSHAIDDIIANGTLAEILARYR